jgi:hypothetical protein
LKDRGER